MTNPLEAYRAPGRFHLTSHEEHGNTGSLTGWFTEVVWDGIETTASSGSSADLGARTVKLIN